MEPNHMALCHDIYLSISECLSRRKAHPDIQVCHKLSSLRDLDELLPIVRNHLLRAKFQRLAWHLDLRLARQDLRLYVQGILL